MNLDCIKSLTLLNNGFKIYKKRGASRIMKKKWNILALLTLLVSLILPLQGVFATETSSDTSTVVVNKIVAEEFVDFPKEHDGTEISDIPGYFGESARPLDGVTFNMWKVTAEQYAGLQAGTLAPSGLGGATSTLVTANGGKAVFSGLEEGYYWFAEDEESAGGITSAIAQSFGLILPFIQEDGSTLSTVNVYPKNISSVEVDKDVASEEGTLVDNDGFDVGQTITYYLNARIPASGNITTFTLTDTLGTGLAFADLLNAQYAIVDAPVTSTDSITGWTALSTTPAGNVAAFDLVAAGAPLDANKGKYVYVKFDAEITSEAVIATDIPNNVTLEFGHSGGDIIEAEPDKSPEVYTGGKKFIKYDRTDSNKALEDAKFVIKNAEGQYLKIGSNGEVTWVEDIGAATEIVSAADGTFEVRGLKYGEPGQDAETGTAATYFLIETVAPSGYTIPTALKEGIPFNVNYTSYNELPTEVPTEPDLTSGNQNSAYVNNTKSPTIPNTGGIGSVIFVVSGLGLIGLAVYGLRRSRKA